MRPKNGIFSYFKCFYDPFQDAIARLERQYEEDKLSALEKQRQEYEKQFQQLKNYMSPSTPYPPYMPYDPFNNGANTNNNNGGGGQAAAHAQGGHNKANGKAATTPNVMSKLEKWGQERYVTSFVHDIGKKLKVIITLALEQSILIPFCKSSFFILNFKSLPYRDETFKRSLAKLREDLVRANGLVREANFFAEELGRGTRFGVTLQIPPHNLSPNRKRGAFVSEPAILVKDKGLPNQVWYKAASYIQK